MKIILTAIAVLLLSGCCIKHKREVARLDELLTATAEACGQSWLKD